MQTGVASARGLGPPPRRVRFRSIDVLLEVWFFRIAALTFGVVPLFIWWIILRSPIIQTVGRNETAVLETVRQRYYKHSSVWDGKSYDVTYSFDTGGGQREIGYGHLETPPPPPKPGDPIAVKVLYVWPHYRAELANYEQPLAGPCIFSVFATASTLVWLIGNPVVWYPTLRERRIMRRGVAVMGSIKQKVKNPQNLERTLWYTFPAADGKMWGNNAVVSPELFERFAEGQAVLVVYMWRRPLASVLYEASKYRAA